MNNFVKKKYGTSSSIMRTDIYSFNHMNINRFYISFNHDGDLDWISIEHIAYDDDFWGLSEGNLTILLDAKKTIVLKPYGTGRWRNPSQNSYALYQYREECSYYITESQLKQIASSPTLQMKVTGNKRSITIYDKNDISKENLSLKTLAQALYNAFYDSSAFVEDLSKATPIEYVKEKVDHIGLAAMLVFVIGGIAAIIGGGIWSLCITSWKPIICCVVIVLIVLFCLLIYQASLERKLK